MDATSANSFWKSVFYREAEWAGLELDGLLDGFRQDDIDYKGLWLWLEQATRPVFAVGAPWLGAANRRRV